ncbi:antitoxin Xre/MbcA/ParS toxin-binding domain-containing protein [Variovorax guangxiensis]|uniref:antitoxin Xre/MbcA/ParS toxin-binding domain-containing protein n=1 Tax=Variovorax guangxiensis TaxID=1775474 RepID=UPI0038F65389
MKERNRSGSAEASLLALATEVFGVDARAWLETPHHFLSGATPSAFAADGGVERVRSILLAIHYGGAV